MSDKLFAIKLNNGDLIEMDSFDAATEAAINLESFLIYVDGAREADLETHEFGVEGIKHRAYRGGIWEDYHPEKEEIYAVMIKRFYPT